MLSRYYIHHPRNFSNEYTIYVATDEETAAWCDAKVERANGEPNETFDRITLKEAIKQGIREPNWHSRKGLDHYGRLYDDDPSFGSDPQGVKDRIKLCAKATREMVQREAAFAEELLANEIRWRAQIEAEGEQMLREEEAYFDALS